MRKLIIAAMRLPLTGQRVLALDADPACRTALAASPHTGPEALADLVRDKVPGVRRFAFLRTEDTGLLREELDRPSSGLCTPYAARNPLAPVELLVKALNSPHPQTALGAYVNPSTPEAERRRLTPARATEMTHVGGSNHDRVVRAHELAVNNPWMLERPDSWDGNVRRALAGLPQATGEHLALIARAGRAGGAALRRHPAVHKDFRDRSPELWSTNELASIGGPATDFLAICRPDFDTDSARHIIKRMGRNEAEPHIIGRIVTRFGPEVLVTDMLPALVIWSGTRYKAASWVAPVMGFLTFDMPLHWAAMRTAFARLGDDRQVWETFLSLMNESWHGTPEEAAEAALSL